jgi:hypothetical protein
MCRTRSLLCLAAGLVLLPAACDRKKIDTEPAGGGGSGSTSGSSEAPAVGAGRKPLLERSREDALQSRQNLKDISRAFFNAESVMGQFSPAVLEPQTRKPLLSWRVALLPYLKEEALYTQFKMDEQWDGPTNKPLLSKMPKVYGLPGSAGYGETNTFYRTFIGNIAAPSGPPVFGMSPAGKDTFRWEPTRLTGITDGTSNTILLAEADESVPWTKPDELIYDPAKPVPKLGFFADDYCHVVMCDGTVRRLKKSVPEKTLRDLITRADGNVIDHSLAFRD